MSKTVKNTWEKSPKSIGWYFWRKHSNSKGMMLFVEKGFSGYVAYMLIANGKTHKYIVDELIGEWQGPLEPEI